jgi:hypothetical protein
MSDIKTLVDPITNQPLDPLVLKLQQELNTVIDIKHLNAANILDALVQGMQIVANIATKTNEQKKIILLDCFNYMILQSVDLSQEVKDDLIWIVDKMGPTVIELFLYVSSKGIDQFKQSKCFSCACLKC